MQKIYLGPKIQFGNNWLQKRLLSYRVPETANAYKIDKKFHAIIQNDFYDRLRKISAVLSSSHALILLFL